ncbi:MAG: aspartyl protease [Prevotella sp.]|nr:aspartyl protease [Prevotella sp.]
MKRLFVLLIIFGGMLPVHAQMYRYNLDFELSAQHFVDTIPIEFEDDQVYISAIIDGRRYRFNLDTGSSQGIAYSNGDMPYGRVLGKVQSRDANGHIDTIQAVSFPTFRIGHLTIRGYSGSLLRHHTTHPKYDACIGFDLFNKGLNAKIDTRQGYLILTDIRDFFDQESGYRFKYRLLRFVPNVRLTPYPGCSDEALFDTGSRRLYVMGSRSLSLFEEKVPAIASQVEGRSHGHRAIGTFGTERADQVSFLWLDGFQLGDYFFNDYHTMTTQGYSRIGGELFRYGSLIVNPRRKRFTFQPYNGEQAVMVSNKQMDIAFVPKNGLPCVGLVWEGSIHYSNGFRQGDVIVQIDGRPIRSFSEFQRYPFIEGREHTFLVRDTQGQLHEVVSVR